MQFGGNEITDMAVIVLAENGHKFMNLKMIKLWRNKITDIGLKSLIENEKNFPYL
jgi:hypothetical protein